MRSTWRAGLLAAVVAAGMTGLPSVVEAQKKNRDLITREEILKSPHRSMELYQVIRSLRPHFLEPPRGTRTLGGGAQSAAVVYLEGNKQGDLSSLQLINPVEVLEVRYLDPSRAENQFGIGHSGGAILVKLWRPEKRDTITHLW